MKYNLFDESSDGEFSNKTSKETIILRTHEDLKRLLNTIDVHAESELRYQDLYTVKHMKNMGGAQYIANSQQNFALLQKLSEKIENKEAFVVYYIRLTGQEVTV